MVKKILAAVSVLALTSAVFAYNPPAGGQNLFRLSSPELLSDGASSAGGAFENISPDSIVNNPALTAFEQRIQLKAAGSMFFDSEDESDKSVGTAFEAGLLLPSRWCVSTFRMQGVFMPFWDMHLGDSIIMTGAVSKDINDKLAVGMSADLGIFYGYDSDWMGGINMGAYYLWGDISFMKNVRFSGALMNIGKPFNNTEVIGIEGIEGGYAEKWPGVATPRMGAAATLFDSTHLDIGACMDFSFPAFQNFVIDAGVQLIFFDNLRVSSGWEYDVREFAEGNKNLIPSVGISCKFNFNSKDGSMLAKKGWEQSEIAVSGAWKQMYENVNAVSLGADLYLGLEDTQAPEIVLWGDE